MCCRRLGLPPDMSIVHNHGPSPDIDMDITPEDIENGDDPKQSMLLARAAENKVAAIMLESGVIFHSIFIGIDIGINSDPSIVRPLMIALMFHQVRENFPLLPHKLDCLSISSSEQPATCSLGNQPAQRFQHLPVCYIGGRDPANPREKTDS